MKLRHLLSLQRTAISNNGWKRKRKEEKTNLYVQITSHKTKHTAHRKVLEFKKDI